MFANYRDKARGKKIYRDNIISMEKGIRRLIKSVKNSMSSKASTTGSKKRVQLRFQAGIAEAITKHIEKEFANMVEKCAIVCEHNRKKTINSDMVKQALKNKVYNVDLMTQKVPFHRYVKELVQHEMEPRFTSKAFDMLQAQYEHMAINAIVFLAKHTRMMERNTVLVRDVELLEHAQVLCTQY